MRRQRGQQMPQGLLLGSQPLDIGHRKAMVIARGDGLELDHLDILVAQVAGDPLVGALDLGGVAFDGLQEMHAVEQQHAGQPVLRIVAPRDAQDFGHRRRLVVRRVGEPAVAAIDHPGEPGLRHAGFGRTVFRHESGGL
jgi:hypothetical protein